MSTIRRGLLLGLLAVVLSLCNVAAAQPALHIAVLPVLDETGGWLDKDCAAKLLYMLSEETRIPLNDCLQIATYELHEDTLPVLQRLEAEQRAATGKKRIDDKLLAPKLAEAFKADLVVYLRVKTYYQRIYYSYHDGPQVESIVDLRLCGYDRRAKRLINESALRHENDDYTPNLNVDVLAQDELYNLLQRANLKSAIFPLAGKN